MALPQRTKRPLFRMGCLGQLVILFVLCALGFVLITGVFAPWAFYLGGTFHITPYWQGWGRAHAKSGDYILYVRIGPTSRNSKMYLETDLGGAANICTPRGENITLKLGGGMRKHLNLSTDGEAIHLYMDRIAWNSQFTADRSPYLELRGHWQNPNLVMDDKGTIARAFLPDGTVSHNRNSPNPQDAIPITFVEGSYSDYSAACKAMHP